VNWTLLRTMLLPQRRDKKFYAGSRQSGPRRADIVPRRNIAGQLGHGFTLLSFGVEIPEVKDVTTVTVDARSCPKGTCLLIKPDDYITARWPALEIDEIASTLNAALDLKCALEASQ